LSNLSYYFSLGIKYGKQTYRLLFSLGLLSQGKAMYRRNLISRQKYSEKDPKLFSRRLDKMKQEEASIGKEAV
jgi:hypothetical protein